MKHTHRYLDSGWLFHGESSERLEFRSSGACFGWFLLMVAALVSWPWTILTGHYQVGIGTFVGLVMLFLGVYWLTMRASLVFDRTRGTLEFTRCSPLGARRESFPLEEVCAVRCALEYMPGNGKSPGHTDAVVDLVFKDGDTFRLGASGVVKDSGEPEMRARGERVCKFLKLPLRDAMSGDEVMVSPADLDRTLAQSLSPAEAASPGDPPAGSRIEIQNVSNGVRYLLPEPSRHPFLKLQRGFVVLGAIILAVILLIFVTAGVLHPESVHNLPVAVAFFALMGWSCYAMFRGLGDITTWRDELVLEQHSISLSRVLREHVRDQQSVNFESVENLRRQDCHRGLSTGQPPIHLRTDEAVLSFGAGLTREESDWLLADLRHRIVIGGRS